ncbi:MAG: putative zinc-binding metallopeptidase [Hyphomicrobium sp.]|nr:putative zinc-binding metallopeptidase [Hyphomicrobium sp.]
MKNYACSKCGNKVYFENVQCVKCSAELGFDPDRLAVIALEPLAEPAGSYRAIGQEASALRYCANAAHAACNWLTPADAGDGFCRACDLNRTIPDLSVNGNLTAWQELERAKKRLVYDLLRFGLPLDTTATGGERLAFDFLVDATTGHLDGVITINVLEADAVERERQRQQFGEPYRSLLGHLRHESGHFYWNVLIAATGRQDAFRTLFGDEREDYGAALARHHAEGPPLDWSERHVSAYASAHPWEDWAETWAHYLHIVSSIDTAQAEGMEPRASGLIFGAAWPFRAYDVYREETFGALMERWIPLTIALNNMSRGMGHNDFYPFVIPAAAYDKLAFVHRAIRDYAAASSPAMTVPGDEGGSHLAPTLPPANTAPA